MRKTVLLTMAAASIMACYAQKSHTPYWLDPAANRIGTEVPRSDFFAYETTNLAAAGNKQTSARYLSLEGKWKFKFAKNHNDAPAKFFS